MRLDFHTHGKLAKKLPFSTAYTDWLFGEARAAGLDALCLTEHFNTLQFAELYGYLASVSRRVGDTLELGNGLRVFPGMETDVAEGGHILTIGPLEAILDLCWVACGRLDGYVELSLQPWDYAAGRLLVEEAGGRVTAPDGSPLSTCQGGPLLASNGKLHAVLQSLLK